MSAENKTARSHGGFTNRKTPKATPRRPEPGPDRRVVFKSVLHNPLQIDWPVIPPALQQKVLSAARQVLKDVAPYYLDRRRGSGSKQKRRRKTAFLSEDRPGAESAPAGDKLDKKRKRDEHADTDADEAGPSEKKRRTDTDDPAAPPPTDDRPLISLSAVSPAPAEIHTTPAQTTARELIPAPPLLEHLTIGLNEVTRLLERSTLVLRDRLYPSPASLTTQRDPHAPTASSHPPTSLQSPAPSANQPPPPPRLILVSKADLNPPLLTAHLPLLVAAYNSLLPPSSLEREGILLIPLPKKGEQAIAESLGLRRAGMVGFSAAAPGLDLLLAALAPAGLRPLTATWLSNPSVNPLATLRSDLPGTRAGQAAGKGKGQATEVGQGAGQYIPTRVKQLRTSAPRDLNRAKRERVEGRRAAKAAKAAKKAKDAKAAVAGAEGTEQRKGRGGKGKGQSDPIPQPTLNHTVSGQTARS